MPTHSYSTTPQTALMGGQKLLMNGIYMGRLKSCNQSTDDLPALREQLKHDGYLFFRNFHPTEKVKKTRQVFLNYLKTKTTPISSSTHSSIKNTQELGQPPAFMNVLESPKLMNFFDEFFGEKSLTFSNKWIRSISPRKYIQSL